MAEVVWGPSRPLFVERLVSEAAFEVSSVLVCAADSWAFEVDLSALEVVFEDLLASEAVAEVDWPVSGAVFEEVQYRAWKG